jgi:hypothetical protein
MKQALHRLLHPTNRSVRIAVGLLLVALLLLQLLGSQENQATATVQRVEGKASEEIETLARTDHVALLELCKQHLKTHNWDRYTCTFVKQERLDGELGGEQHIDVKFMTTPFSAAMHWTKNAPLGDALLYVQGKYPDEKGRSQMLVRPKSGFLQKLVGGSVLRLPDGRDAMKNTLRPVTSFGFANSIQSLIDIYKIARERNECIEKFDGFAELDGRKCIVLVRLLPRRDDYPAQKTVILIDQEYLLPVQVIGYGWEDDELLCNYEFRKVDFNAELTAEDFTPQANQIQTK